MISHRIRRSDYGYVELALGFGASVQCSLLVRYCDKACVKLGIVVNVVQLLIDKQGGSICSQHQLVC